MITSYSLIKLSVNLNKTGKGKIHYFVILFWTKTFPRKTRAVNSLPTLNQSCLLQIRCKWESVKQVPKAITHLDGHVMINGEFAHNDHFRLLPQCFQPFDSYTFIYRECTYLNVKRKPKHNKKKVGSN